MGGEFDKSQNQDFHRKSCIQMDRCKTLIPIAFKRTGRKKAKILVRDEDDDSVSQELRMMELIQDKNPKKMDYSLINNCLEKNHFMHFKSSEKNEIISNMSLYKVKPHMTIYNQGSYGYFWFIVASGELDLYVDKKKCKTFVKGDNFGENALKNCPHDGTVKAVTESELWVLNKEFFEKIKSNTKENMDFLKTIKLPVNDKIKSDMANYLVKNIYKAKDIICKEGEISTSINIIKEGEVNFLKNDNIVKTAKKFDFFGENGFFEGNNWDMDVIAKTNCTIFSISTEFFQNQFEEDFIDQLYFTLLKIAFSRSSKFKSINTTNLNKIFKWFTIKTFRKNSVVIRKDTDISKKLCVILDGNIIDKGTNKIIGEAYNILFEENILNENEFKIKSDLISESNCIIAEALYEDVKRTLGENIKSEKRSITQEMMAIENVKFCKYLNSAKKELFLKNLKPVKFNNGEKILTQGQMDDKLYIIKKGKVDFFLDSKYIKSEFEGDDFNSKSVIINDRKNYATVVANGQVECYTITSEAVKNILSAQLKQYFLNQIYLNDYSIQLEDFENVKTLGQGSYGVVNLVRNKKNKQLYAVKAMDLMQIKEENILKRVDLEKSLLLKMEHPFIAKTIKYIKGEIYLYYIMEYVRGKELFDVMRDINLLNKKQTQFYSSSTLEVINYLHSHKIIYRDLKPENIMVLENGYIKFFDFGTVKEVNNNNNRTKTFIGTISYMAPEIFTGQGYSFPIDIWALGIMMYEFLCGKLPFGEDIEDPAEFYNTMINEKLTFPNFIHDEAFKDLISKLLIKDPNKRLCQYSKIRNHAFFKDFDWDKLISLTMPAPHKFKLNDINVNCSNPEPYLTYLKGLGKQPYNKMKQSIRQIKFKKWLKDF